METGGRELGQGTAHRQGAVPQRMRLHGSCKSCSEGLDVGRACWKVSLYLREYGLFAASMYCAHTVQKGSEYLESTWDALRCMLTGHARSVALLYATFARVEHSLSKSA